MIGEWYRESVSKLERTLRVPYLVKNAVILFLCRTLVVWVAWGLGLEFVFHNLLVAVFLGLILTLITEMFLVREWLLGKIIPRHIKNLELVKKWQNEAKEKGLIEVIKKSVDLSAWGMINIVYAAPQSWGWEIVFRILYPFVVRPNGIYCSDLLVGFPNKTVEADQLMWEAANEADPESRRKLMDQYLEEYGSRVDDVDLAKPTLRENVEAVTALVELYKDSESPRRSVEKAQKRRETATREIAGYLRVPKSWFLSFLKLVQNNVQLREDRRFYEFVMDYYLRQMIFKLADNLKISRKEIFNKSWKEIKHAAVN